MGGLIDVAKLSGSLKPRWQRIILIYEAKPSDSSTAVPFEAAMTHHYEVSLFPLLVS